MKNPKINESLIIGVDLVDILFSSWTASNGM